MILPIMPFTMIELGKLFRHVVEYDGDVWVADYTEATQRMERESQKGVVISRNPIDDKIGRAHV